MYKQTSCTLCHSLQLSTSQSPSQQTVGVRWSYKELIFFPSKYILSRTVKGLRCFMNLVSRMLAEDVRLLGQSQRVLLTAQQGAWASSSCEFPWPPKSHGDNIKGPSHAARVVGLCYVWGILHLGTSSLLFGCKQPCRTFVPERDIIFVIMNSKTACPLLQWEALSLSSKAVHYTDILEKTAHISASAGKMCGSMRGAWRTASQQPLKDSGITNLSHCNWTQG